MSSTSNSSLILEQLSALLGPVKPTSRVQSARTKRDTIADARRKVADKLRANKAHFSDPDSGEKPDPVFKRQGDGTLAVGIKYGNRFLKGVFGGETYVPVPEDKVDQALDLMASQVEQGLYDSAIEEVMEANRNGTPK